MKSEGYDIGDALMDKEAIMEAVLNNPEARILSPELNVKYRMSTEEYYDLTPYVKELDAVELDLPTICQGHTFPLVMCGEYKLGNPPRRKKTICCLDSPGAFWHLGNWRLGAVALHCGCSLPLASCVCGM